MKQYIVALMLACSIQGHSQDVKQATFVPPFDFTLTPVSYTHLRAHET